MKRLSTHFAKNRAEELPDDLWERYVLPLRYLDNNLLNFSKSAVVIGGRGSGKTMFLKYHCYPTIFSTKKTTIPLSDMSNIGIHWRPDTDFAHMITEVYLDTKWKVAFEAYIGLSIFSEFSKLFKSFIQSNYIDEEDKIKVSSAMIPTEFLKIFKLENETKVIDFDKICQNLRSELNDWLNYPEGKPPIIFGAKEKWHYFINFVTKLLNPFKDTTFHIFIDEFENLPLEHQTLINTWIKHSEAPLIFHIAYKKHSIVSKNTQGNEQIVHVNDYRIVDLEKIYADSFEVLAAEIISSKLNKYFNHSQDSHSLSDISSLESRNNETYQKNIKENIQRIFPSLTIIETTNEFFKDQALIKKLEKVIENALKEKHSTLDPKSFLDLNKKRESIINGVLLSRKNTNVSTVQAAFIENNEEFYAPHINNNLLGALLYYYRTYKNKTCPYYAGFDRFILLSQANIRHLLELCYQSILEYESQNSYKDIHFDNFTISVSSQSIATKHMSKMQIDKISGLGKYNKDLQKIAIRLGKIFALSQTRASQSIAELNQFTLKNYQLNNDEDVKVSTLINECKVWGILQEEVNNKVTTEKDNDSYLYILHPVFSPHFGISPRKKRKIDFTYQQLKTIFISSENNYQLLHNNYAKEWKVDENDTISYNTNTLLDFM